MHRVLRRMSAPKMVYLAIIFSFVFQSLLAPLAYALEGDATILDNVAPSAPTGGSPIARPSGILPFLLHGLPRKMKLA